MPSTYSQLITKIKPFILAKDFEAPLNQTTDTYFPDFLNAALDKYVNFYKTQLVAPPLSEVSPLRSNTI